MNVYWPEGLSYAPRFGEDAEVEAVFWSVLGQPRTWTPRLVGVVGPVDVKQRLGCAEAVHASG